MLNNYRIDRVLGLTGQPDEKVERVHKDLGWSSKNRTTQHKLFGFVQTTPFWLSRFVWSSLRRNSNDGQAFCLRSQRKVPQGKLGG